MNHRIFVDYDVLVTAHNPRASKRQLESAIAIKRVWENRTGVVSLGVLRSLYDALTKRKHQRMDRSDAQRLINDYLCWEVISEDVTILAESLRMASETSLELEECLTVCAAWLSSASKVFSYRFIGLDLSPMELEVVHPKNVHVP